MSTPFGIHADLSSSEKKLLRRKRKVKTAQLGRWVEESRLLEVLMADVMEGVLTRAAHQEVISDQHSCLESMLTRAASKVSNPKFMKSVKGKKIFMDQAIEKMAGKRPNYNRLQIEKIPSNTKRSQNYNSSIDFDCKTRLSSIFGSS